MDAPDFDELQWMVQQEEEWIEHHEDEFSRDMHDSLGFEAEPSEPEFPHSAAGVVKVLPELQYNAGEKRPLSTEQELDPCKKVRTSDGVSFHDSINNETLGKDPFSPKESEWSPTSPLEEISETSVNVDSKLPVRRLAAIKGNFMPITSPSGDRVYADVKEIEKTSDRLQSIHGAGRNSKRGTGLLCEPFEVLLEQVEQNLLMQTSTSGDCQDVSENTMTESSAHEALWVEKYAPKSFTELLSDEQTNREVLRWLKQWDKCVFGEKRTCTSVDVLTALKRHPPMFQNRGIGGREGHNNSKAGWMDIKSNSSVDSNGGIRISEDRPEERILLLCGPPGLGKTTLAHVAAKHCGYRVVEINASDDRVATTLKAKILDAVQMKSVMGDLRPNCVVIDEIDGALGGSDGKSAIDALLKIAYAGTKEHALKENENDSAFVKKTSKKKTSSDSALSRPVICICNDPYAPALRQLRQMAKVHVFTQPSVNRVVTRLKYICNSEGYKISARALTVLADHTECDIRSCLNTLQFLNKRKESLNTLDVASQVVGRKDMTRSAFDVWGEILQKRKPKQGRFSGSSAYTFGNCGQQSKELIHLHDLLANHGDFELTNSGIYDNLIHVRYQDSSLQKTVQCLELLGDSEIMDHYALRHQNFILNVYQPAIVLTIRNLVAQPEKPFMEWPKTLQRFKVDYSAKQDILKSWMMKMQSATYRNFRADCLISDLISPLLSILAPQRLRPVASQLLSQHEKEELNDLVDTMIAYGLNYKMPKNGAESFSEASGPVLEPPIIKLIQFKDYQMEHRYFSSTIRQVLSHEVDLEIIRRESVARSSRAAASTASELKRHSVAEMQEVDVPPHVKPEDVMEAAVTSAPGVTDASTHKSIKATTAARPITKPASKPTVDPFAHFRRVSSCNNGKGNVDKDARTKNALAQRDARPIFFKFNEGFTNAIRRPVLVRDLI